MDEIFEKELEDSPKFIKYFKSFGTVTEPDPTRQAKIIYLIDDFMFRHKFALEKKIAKYKNIQYPTTSGYVQHAYMIFFMLILYNKEIDQKILETEKEHMTELLELLTEFKEILVKHPKLYINVQQLTNHLTDVIKNEKTYHKYKQMRRSILSKIRYFQRNKNNIVANYTKVLAQEFISANQRYQTEFAYSPPSSFDAYFFEYIIQSPLKARIEPTIRTIASGNIEKSVEEISDFALEVYKALNLEEKSNSRPIVFTSLVRMLFKESYPLGSDLSKYNKENGEFLIKCEEFSQQRVKDLKLSKDIIEGYTPGLTVQSLFKSKQVDMLKQMELMTNPIDLMKHVHNILLAIAKLFWGGKPMSFDDTFTLLLALMSLSPPANAVSIAKFVSKWDDIQLSPVVGMSKNYFIAAIEQLMGTVD